MTNSLTEMNPGSGLPIPGPRPSTHDHHLRSQSHTSRSGTRTPGSASIIGPNQDPLSTRDRNQDPLPTRNRNQVPFPTRAWIRDSEPPRPRPRPSDSDLSSRFPAGLSPWPMTPTPAGTWLHGERRAAWISNQAFPRGKQRTHAGTLGV